jgi:hypothetical protein
MLKIKITAKNVMVAIGGIFFVLSFAAVGLHYQLFSSAATNHNPYGYIDTCQLVDGSTDMIGWAADPDAPAGDAPDVSVTITPSSGTATTKTFATSVAGYHDADINAYIKKYHPGDPTSSIYGFNGSIGSLVAGKTYRVSGIVFNYGAGTNQAIGVNSASYADGDTADPYFSGDDVPNACLTPAPVPAPSPAPTPKPPAPTTPTKTVVVTKQVAPSAAKPSATPASTIKTPTPVAVTPVVITTGQPTVKTTASSADIALPLQNATAVALHYGTSPTNLSGFANGEVSNGIASFSVTNLKPDTSYYYQVSSIAADGTTNQTTTAQFLTAKLAANHLPNGMGQSASNHSSIGTIVGSLLVLLLLLAGGLLFFLKHRSVNSPVAHSMAPQRLPEPVPVEQQQAVVSPVDSIDPNDITAPHAGESLKVMVLRAMAEEAAKRKQQP